MNRPLRALIVDDERPGRVFLRELLLRESAVEVVGECGDGAAALQWLDEHDADILFLDIRMPGLDGFEVLAQLDPSTRPAPIFVTAYDDFALRAIHAQIWDYLLKPFDAQRLHETLVRVRGRLAREQASSTMSFKDSLLAAPTVIKRHPERLALPEGRGRVAIRVTEIEWCEADANYVTIHLADRSFLVRVSLGELEAKLDPQAFVRIHRSAIVNVDRIMRLEPRGHGDMVVMLNGGRELNLSRRYRNRLEEVLLSLS